MKTCTVRGRAPGTVHSLGRVADPTIRPVRHRRCSAARSTRRTSATSSLPSTCATRSSSTASCSMVANVPWQKEGQPRRSPPAADRLRHGRGGGPRRRRARGRAASRSTAAGRATPPTRWPSWQRGQPDAELFTIVGDDAAAGLLTWERYDEVVAPLDAWSWSSGPACRLRAARRGALGACRGAPPRGVEHRPAGPLRRRPSARLPGPREDASATAIRRRALYARRWRRAGRGGRRARGRR